MQLKPQVTLNGLPLRYTLLFLPSSSSNSCLTHVVLLSMAFLGTYIQHLSFFLDCFGDIDVVYSFISHWLMFWTWYKFHPPKYKPIPNKAIQKKARQHLKLLMLASAVIPSMGSVDKPYLSKQGHINPNKIITSTTNLCGYNLTELKSRLSKSPLFSLYKGLMNPEVRPVLMLSLIHI